jgi:hypothetical protein
MTEPGEQSGWKTSARGEAAWNEAQQDVAARNADARKSGKLRREASARERDSARRAAEARSQAQFLSRHRTP